MEFMVGTPEHTCTFRARDGKDAWVPHRVLSISARPMAISAFRTGLLYQRSEAGGVDIYALVDEGDPHSCTVFFETERGVVSFAHGDFFGPKVTEEQCVLLENMINDFWGNNES